jgi:hypothetical protein
MARSSLHFNYILLLALTSTVFGQTPSTSTGPSNTVNSFPTITDTEGTGQLGGNVGSTGSGSKQGASGGSSALSLSGGAIAGIAIPCGLVVIGVGKLLYHSLGDYANLFVVVLWALWFYGRREEMTFRQTINRVGRRVTGRAVPPTPRMMRKMTLPNEGKSSPSVYNKRDVEKGTSSRSETSLQETFVRPTQKNNKYDAFMGRS